MTEPIEHMEHAEHNAHAHDPFDKRVAGTMAVIAVILAITAMLSHAANGETLSKQVDSGTAKSEAIDQWALFQAKKNRAHTDEAMLALTKMNIAARESAATRPAEAATIQAWEKEFARYEKDAEESKEKAAKFAEESDALKEESIAEKKKAEVLDLAELTVQVSLVLCSVAILSKRHAFWFSGIIVATVGICIGGYGLSMSVVGKPMPASTTSPSTRPQTPAP